jgi:prohibitin 2
MSHVTHVITLPIVSRTQAVAENPGFLNLRKIDAAREIANTIANSQNRVFLDANSLLLDVNSTTIDESKLMKAKKAQAKSSW